MKEKINEEINNQNAEQKTFASFEDFKNAVLKLPQEFLPPFLKKPNQPKRPSEITLLNFGLRGFENMDLPNDEELIEEAENESSLSRIVSMESALKELYKITNGIMYNYTTVLGNSLEESFRLFHDEIFNLWRNRIMPEPVKIKSYCAISIENEEKQIPELEKRKINSEKEKQEILDKTKVMGPKKKEAYLKNKIIELDDLEKTIKGLADMIIYTKESIKKLKINTQKELLAKKMINARMPYLSGSEYFESYMNSLDHIFRHYSKKARNKFEDILLEWALQFQDTLPLKIQNKQEANIKQDKQITELNSLQKKLLDELWRAYPVIEQNPNEVNLQHGNLIFQNLLRVLEK